MDVSLFPPRVTWRYLDYGPNQAGISLSRAINFRMGCYNIHFITFGDKKIFFTYFSCYRDQKLRESENRVKIGYFMLFCKARHSQPFCSA